MLRSWFRTFLLGLAIAWTLKLAIPAAPAGAFAAPPGFKLLEERPGVALYGKDYQSDTPDFVQVIDLGAGATVHLLNGPPASRSGQHNRGIYGGANPSFGEATISQYWGAFSRSQPQAFCVTNGQFFYMPESPSPLGLPLKVDGQVLAEGFGYSQYPEKQVMFELWPGKADIQPLTRDRLYTTSAPDVLGGLTEDANKKPKTVVGRTFVGIADENGDGSFETVAVLTTRAANQATAAGILRGFGMSKVMMLDGGGSTQLVCSGKPYIDTTRALPQAIGVSGPPSGGSPVPSSAEAASIAQAGTPHNPEPTLIPTQVKPITSSAGAAKPVAIQPTPLTQPTLPSSPPAPATMTRTTQAQSPAMMPIIKKLQLPAQPAAQAGFAVLPAARRTDQAGSSPSGSSLPDVLWLPIVMSPVSAIFFIAVRRRRWNITG